MKTKMILIGLLIIACVGLFVKVSDAVYMPEKEEKKEGIAAVSQPPSTPPKLDIVERMKEPKEPEYAPGQIIVKFKGKTAQEVAQSITQTKECTITQTAVADSAPSIASLNTKYKVKKIEPVFKGLHKQSTPAKLMTAQEQASVIAQKYPERVSPTPKDAKVPDLENIYILEVGEDVNVLQAVDEYKKDPNVEYAEPNYIVKIQMVPNDPYYSSTGSWGQPYDDLWGIKKINCEQAWDISQGEGVVVAVIDTGVDYNHEDIAENIWINEDEIPGNGIDDDNNGYIDDIRGYDFAYGDNDPMDGCGHGTHCAGTIAAIGNNNKGVIGVAPKAKVMVLKGLEDDGGGWDDKLANAVKYAADNGARVLSNSWSGYGRSQVLEDAFNYAYSKGCISIAAAGNDCVDVLNMFPANLSTVIAVAATTQNDEKCLFSNFGSKIDVAAPGGGYQDELGTGVENLYNILSTLPDNSVEAGMHPNRKVSDGYYRLAGTSMACPHVSGLAALIVDKMSKTDPDYSPQKVHDEVQLRILAGADGLIVPNSNFEALYRINAYNSLNMENPRQLLRITAIEASGIWPGHDGKIILYLKNLGLDAHGVDAALATSHQSVTIVNSSVTFGDISTDQSKANADVPFIIRVDQGISPGEAIHFTVTLQSQDGYQKVYPFDLIHVGEGGNLPLLDLMPIYVMMQDYNNDSYSDVFFVGWSYTDLYKNSQKGFFDKVTSSAGLDKIGMSQMPLFMDIDNDGDQDLYTTEAQDKTNGQVHGFLFLNNGDGTFSDISEASGIKDIKGCVAISVDYDKDGFVDIFGTRISQDDKACLFLLKNNGDRTFTNVIQTTGISEQISAWYDRAVNNQLASLDYNNDDNPDLVVGNTDSGIKLYRNNGNGTFTDVSSEAGLTPPDDILFALGVAVGDYNNDGYTDVFCTSCTNQYGNAPNGNANKLFKNNGNGTFTDVTEEAGNVGAGSGGQWWGNDFFDYDNDGDLDLHITDAGGYPISGNTLYINNGNGTFTLGEGIYPKDATPGWAAACIGDYNNDGALDIYAPSGLNRKGVLLRNTAGIRNNWIKIKLIGVASNRDAYGARVYVKTGTLNQTREVHTSSVETQPLHFGLGKAIKADEITIVWPVGTVQVLKDVSINQLLTITEVKPQAVVTGPPFVYESGQAPNNFTYPANPSMALLDGSASVGARTYHWIQTAGPTCTIKEPNAITTSFTTPSPAPGSEYPKGTTVTFVLAINEGEKDEVRSNPLVIPLRLSGDANGDDKVNVGDLNRVRSAILGNPCNLRACDINGSGKVTVLDYAIVVTYILNSSRSRK